MSGEQRSDSFESVKDRLDQIAEDVAREDLPLDEALALYEEAVKLGLKACDLSEIGPFDAQEDASEGAAAALEDAAEGVEGAAEVIEASEVSADAAGTAQADAPEAPEPQVDEPFAAVRIDDGASLSIPGAGSDL